MPDHRLETDSMGAIRVPAAALFGAQTARSLVHFAVGRDTCAAWLYRPPGVDGPVPCVVLAHGFGMTRDCRPGAWAERFAAAGMAATSAAPCSPPPR